MHYVRITSSSFIERHKNFCGVHRILEGDLMNRGISWFQFTWSMGRKIFLSFGDFRGDCFIWVASWEIPLKAYVWSRTRPFSPDCKVLVCWKW